VRFFLMNTNYRFYQIVDSWYKPYLCQESSIRKWGYGSNLEMYIFHTFSMRKDRYLLYIWGQLQLSHYRVYCYYVIIVIILVSLDSFWDIICFGIINYFVCGCYVIILRVQIQVLHSVNLYSFSFYLLYEVCLE
jgi:hypothetical protein